MRNVKALIFDVDGTLADTETVHLAAFNQAFAEVGLDWHWDVPLYTQLLEVSGGKERLRAYGHTRTGGFGEMGPEAVDRLVERLHAHKTAAYERAVQGGAVTLRPGVRRLVEQAIAAGLRVAIATTTSPANIASLLRHCFEPKTARHFTVIEDASTAPRKKPDPMAYRQALQRLGLAACDCVAFEDSRNGLLAACAVGLPTVITVNPFTAHHDFSGAWRVLPDLSGVELHEFTPATPATHAHQFKDS